MNEHTETMQASDGLPPEFLEKKEEGEEKDDEDEKDEDEDEEKDE